MNPYEQSIHLLRVCPIPSSIQQIIYYLLVGFGTETANAIRTAPAISDEPIKTVAFGPLGRCRHTLYYWNYTINHYYDNASHFSRLALYELHLIYLINSPPLPYIFSRIQDITSSLRVLIKNRLMRFVVEDSLMRLVSDRI
jgi:hypothetical protein